MNFPGVVNGDPGVMAKLAGGAAHIDGHAPGLSGRALCAYVAAGIQSDHECVTAEEAREKLGLGLHIMIREGSTARNLEALLPAVRLENAGRFSLVTDDVDPADLSSKGHLDYVVNRAVRFGLDPVLALQMVTINSARCFGLRDRGAIAPGLRADLAVFEDPRDIQVQQVYKERVSRSHRREDGLLRRPRARRTRPEHRGACGGTVLRISPCRRPGKRLRVIGVVPGQIVTRTRVMEARVEAGLVLSDVDRDVLKVAIAERHGRTGHVGFGFVHGFGLKRGALASSVAHDSHNVIAAGVGDEDLRAGFRAVEEMQGGLAAVLDGRPIARLPLPIAGLMSDSPHRSRHRAA